MTARWVLLGTVLGVMMGAVAGYASAEPAPGLAGLDEQLNTTGRIGPYAPPPSSQIAPAIAPEASDRDSAPRALQPLATDRSNLREQVKRQGGLAEEEFMPTEAPVTACRVEVARRRQVSPKKLAAKEVVLRFNVEADGHVRDAEAVSAPGTDLEIAACAKRVLSEWVFAKHLGDAIAVERTYRFR
jgi:hypothetical protein